MLEGYNRKFINNHNMKMKAAWFAAYLPRHEKPVSMDSLFIHEPKEHREQTPLQQIDQLKVICAAHGGVIREV